MDRSRAVSRFLDEWNYGLVEPSTRQVDQVNRLIFQPGWLLSFSRFDIVNLLHLATVPDALA